MSGDSLIDENYLDDPAFSSASKVITGAPIARLFCRNQFEYLINKTRIVVGRTALKKTSQGVDVEINDTLYVSRRHFEIYTSNCSQFYLIVLSKNGLFVDGVFRRYHSIPCVLSKMCRIRFPKTNIKLYFQILEQSEIELDQINDIQHSTADENNEVGIKRPLNIETEEDSIDMKLAKLDSLPNKEESCQGSQAEKLGGAKTMPSTNSARKPPYSYSQMIAQAITLTTEKQLSLSDIYNYIAHTYPYYKIDDKGWQNSIRHNLSLNASFVRIKRPHEEGKGALWAIKQPDEKQLVKNAFKARGTTKRQILDHGGNSNLDLRYSGPMLGSDESLDLDDDFSLMDGQMLLDLNPFPIIINNNNLPINYQPEPSSYFTTNIMTSVSSSSKQQGSINSAAFNQYEIAASNIDQQQLFSLSDYSQEAALSSAACSQQENAAGSDYQLQQPLMGQSSIFANGRIIRLSSF